MRKLSPPATVTPTTPLRLEIAAQLAFPDGSISTGALRRLAAAGKLPHEKIAGKYFVTLAGIEEMRAACRVAAKTASTKSSESSGEDSGVSAVAAMNARAATLLESLRPKSSQKAIRRR